MGGQISTDAEKDIEARLADAKLKEELAKPKPKTRPKYLEKPVEIHVSVEDHEVQDYKLQQIFSVDNWVNFRGHKPKSKPEIPQSVLLTPHQKQLIRVSWQTFYKKGDDIEKLADVGVNMFSRIFDLSPKIKSLFPYNGMYGAELSKNKTFRAHSTRFLATIANAVKNLDELDTKVAPAFVNLGKRHREFKGLDDIESGNNFFGVFTGSMLYGLNEELDANAENAQEIREAWCKFLDFLMQHVQYGYNLKD